MYLKCGFTIATFPDTALGGAISSISFLTISSSAVSLAHYGLDVLPGTGDSAAVIGPDLLLCALSFLVAKRPRNTCNESNCH